MIRTGRLPDAPRTTGCLRIKLEAYEGVERSMRSAAGVLEADLLTNRFGEILQKPAMVCQKPAMF
jgi:hypothetical protein